MNELPQTGLVTVLTICTTTPAPVMVGWSKVQTVPHSNCLSAAQTTVKDELVNVTVWLQVTALPQRSATR